MEPNWPSNEELGRIVEGEFAGYVDSGIWEMEDWLARREKLRLHLKLSLEDATEE